MTNIPGLLFLLAFQALEEIAGFTIGGVAF